MTGRDDERLQRSVDELGALSSTAFDATSFTITVPPGTPSEVVDATYARGADRARDPVGQGQLLRLWKLPDDGRTLGLWRAHDTNEMEAILYSLPLHAWANVGITPLTPHPSDPG